MPLYDVWWRSGGATKPPEKRWKKLGKIEHWAPYWGGAQMFTDGVRSELVKPLFDLLQKHPSFSRVPISQLSRASVSTNPVTVMHLQLRPPGGRFRELVIAPPYNVIYDLRNHPQGDEYGAVDSPLVLGLPGMVEATGDVLQQWPWDRHGAVVPVAQIDERLPEVRVAIDQALERGLAGLGLPVNDVAYELTHEVHAELKNIAFYHEGPPTMWAFPGAKVSRIFLFAAGYDRYSTNPTEMLVAIFVNYQLPGERTDRYMQRHTTVKHLLEAKHEQLIDMVHGMDHNICVDIELSEQTVQNLRVWVDDQLERGHWREPVGLSGTLVRKKEPRQAVVRETKKEVRSSPFPPENVVGFKMPQGAGILLAQPQPNGSYEAETYYLYAFDTQKNADAYHAGVMAGTTKLFVFPARGFNVSPITDVWAKWNKPPKGCVGIYFIGAYEHGAERILFVDMMSVRPQWQRYGINTGMLFYMQQRWPGRQLLFSDTTNAGHAYAEWWRSQGREVKEQNEAFWKRTGKMRLLDE